MMKSMMGQHRKAAGGDGNMQEDEKGVEIHLTPPDKKRKASAEEVLALQDRQRCEEARCEEVGDDEDDTGAGALLDILGSRDKERAAARGAKAEAACGTADGKKAAAKAKASAKKAGGGKKDGKKDGEKDGKKDGKKGGKKGAKAKETMPGFSIEWSRSQVHGLPKTALHRFGVQSHVSSS